MSIAELGVKVTGAGVVLTTNQLEQLAVAARKAEGRSETLTRSVKRQSAAFGFLRGQMRSVLVAYAGFAALRATISTLSDFESGMSKVAAVTRASAGELAAMRDIAKELGATTEFTAAQAASGLGFLGMAGFNAAESIAAIPAILNLATAASMDLGSAADIASNIMSGFGIEASKAGDVADILAAVTSRANTNVSQLGEAMKRVGPVAAGLGISMNDAAAALGILADAGLQGSIGGTGLKRILSELISPSDAARDALSRMGVSLDDVNPKTNDLASIISTLADATLEVEDAFTIVGDIGAPALLALVRGADGLGDLTSEMRSVSGEADIMADIMRDNVGGDITILKSAVSGLIIAMGEAGLTAVIRAVAQSLTILVRFLTAVATGVGFLISSVASAVGWLWPFEAALDDSGEAMGVLAVLSGFLSDNMVVIANSATIAAGVFGGPMVASFIAARLGALSFAGALGVLKSALMLASIGALIIGAGILVTWFMKLVKGAGGFGAALGVLKEVALEVWERVELGAAGMASGLMAAFGRVKIAWLQMLNDMHFYWAAFLRGLSFAFGAIPGMGGVADDLFAASQGNVDSIVAAIGTIESLNDANLALGRAAGDAFGLSVAPLESLVALKDLVSDITDEGGDATDAAADLAAALADLPDVALDAGGGLGELADAAESLAKSLDDRVLSAIDDLGAAFKDFAMDGFKDFQGFAKSVLNTFKTMLLDMVIMAAKSKIMIGIEAGGGGIDGIMSLFKGGGGGGGLLAGVLGSFGTAAAGGATGLLGGLGSTLGVGAASGASTGLFGIGAGATAAGGGIMATLGAALPLLGVGLALFSLFKPKISKKDFAAIQDGLDLTGMALFETGRKGRGMAADLLKSFGSIEEYTKATSGYYDKFFTEEEKRQRAIDSITKSFDAMGLSLPDSTESFRAIVEAQDLTTKSGRKTYAELLKVSGAFADVYGGVKSVNSAFALMNARSGIFATLQDEIFATVYKKPSTTAVSVPKTAGGVGDDAVGLLRRISKDIVTGNLNIAKNTSDTAGWLERSALEPAA